MDNLKFGLTTAITGILVVFVGLLILILCIRALTLFTGRTKRDVEQQTGTPDVLPEDTAVPVSLSEAQNDGQLIAVITAAIAAVWQAEENTSGFVVRRIKRFVR